MSLVGALFFIGIDWAAKTHAVCVLDPAGRAVAAFSTEHTAAGFIGLIRRLAKLGAPGEMPVAIERPGGSTLNWPHCSSVFRPHLWPGVVRA